MGSVAQTELGVRTQRGRAELEQLIDVPTLKQLVDRHIAQVMEQCHGEVALASKVLGMGRATLYRHILRLQIETRGARLEAAKLEQARRAEQIWREFVCRGPKL